MDFDRQKQIAVRMRLTLQMHEDGVRMYQQTLRRKYPNASELEIDQRLGHWLHRTEEIEWPFRIVYPDIQSQS